MTQNHTPGPWKFRDSHGALCAYEVYIREGDPYDDIVAGEHGIEKEEDARLIAAAPELLEAIKAYVFSVNQMNDAMKDGLNVHGAVAALVGAEDMAKHAIAKAEGTGE